jgi:hypothetical protein
MEQVINTVVLEYMRWLYAAPIFTFLFSAGAVVVLALSLVDSAFWLARQVVK